MLWKDQSDRTSRFFTAEVHGETDLTKLAIVLRHIVDLLREEVAGHGNALEFDTAFIEVCLDSGRIVAALGTDAQRESGRLDGCSLRWQPLQDFWNDLVDTNMPEDEFVEQVTNMVVRIGEVYESILTSGADIFPHASRLDLVVFGGSPGEALSRRVLRG